MVYDTPRNLCEEVSLLSSGQILETSSVDDYRDDPVVPAEMQPCTSWRTILQGDTQKLDRPRPSRSAPPWPDPDTDMDPEMQLVMRDLRKASKSRNKDTDSDGVAVASSLDRILYHTLSIKLRHRSPRPKRTYSAQILDIVRFPHDVCGSLGFNMPIGVTELQAVLFNLEGWGFYPMWSTRKFMMDLRKKGDVEPGTRFMFRITGERSDPFLLEHME